MQPSHTKALIGCHLPTMVKMGGGGGLGPGCEIECLTFSQQEQHKRAVKESEKLPPAQFSHVQTDHISIILMNI